PRTPPKSPGRCAGLTCLAPSVRTSVASLEARGGRVGGRRGLTEYMFWCTLRWLAGSGGWPLKMAGNGRFCHAREKNVAGFRKWHGLARQEKKSRVRVATLATIEVPRNVPKCPI